MNERIIDQLKIYFLTIFFLCFLLGGQILAGNKISTLPFPLLPDKSLADRDPKLFFEKFGKFVAGKMHNRGKDSTNKQKAKKVLIMLGKISDYYELKANIDLFGRAFQLGNKYNCGWWQNNLRYAFIGVGIPNEDIQNIESTGYNIVWNTVNYVHAALFIVDNNGKLYTFDVWQHGADGIITKGLVSIMGVGNSPNNAMPRAKWIKNQGRRDIITYDSEDLEDSDFLYGLVKKTKYRLYEKYDINISRLFGSQAAMGKYISGLFINLIKTEDSVNKDIIDKLLDEKIKELRSKQTVKAPYLWGDTPTEADKKIEKANLGKDKDKCKEIACDPAKTSMLGKIFYQTKEADEIMHPGDSIGYFYYSKTKIKAPSLLGLSPNDANAKIGKAQLKVGKSNKTPLKLNKKELAGKIYYQKQTPGEPVTIGKEIDYSYYAKILAKVKIPKLLNKTPVQANDLLTKKKLLTGSVTKTPYNPKQPSMEGKIYSQDKTGTVEIGTAVSYKYYAQKNQNVSTATTLPAREFPGGLIIVLRGGDRKIFVGNRPVFEAWDAGKQNRYDPKDIEWVSSRDTILPVDPKTGIGSAIKAGDVTIMLKGKDRASYWPAFMDIIVWEKVPSLTGLTLNAARKILMPKGLNLEPANPLEKRVGNPKIIKHKPKKGTPVKAGSVITVYLSNSSDADSGINGSGDSGGASGGDDDADNEEDEDKTDGKKTVIVPDATGMSTKQAKSIISSKGLAASLIGGDPAPDKNSEYKVQKQVPAGGIKVEKNSSVSVFIFSKYKPKLIVPNVVGIFYKDAKAAIAELKLQSKAVWGDKAPQISLIGNVQSQQPASGETIKPGLTVKIFIYAAVVPNVQGMTMENAKGIISDTGLSPNMIWGDKTKNKKLIKTVQSQEPAPGKKVLKDTKVTAKIYKKYVKKESSYNSMLGIWKGTSFSKESKPTPMELTILKIEMNGKFHAHLYTKADIGSECVLNVIGSFKGNNVSFTTTKRLKGKCMKGFSSFKKIKHIGKYNSKTKTIQGTYRIKIDIFYFPLNFSLQKQ